MNHIVAAKEIAASLTDFWSPRIVAELDDSYVKVAKLFGSLVWHSHDDEDELFFILKGNLRIEMEDHTIDLQEGQLYVVPKGVKHNPIAESECHIMLIEKKSTKHTGNEVTEQSKSLAQQLA
jgi:mannose-6-phosphate isomerase-like protein (cupin superfamily)